jgi:DNA-binding MarR family transcriptional regulator
MPDPDETMMVAWGGATSAVTSERISAIHPDAIAAEATALEERDLLAAQIIRLATLVRRAASQRFRRMFDLSTLEWLVVVHLACEAPLSLTTLARNATLDPQRASLAATRLVKRELVSRTKNPHNAREAQIALTPRGHAVFNAIIENWLNKELAAGLSESETKAAGELVKRLVLKAEQILERDTKGYR